MANKDHTSLLRKGVTAWNSWRGEHRGIQPDLFGAFLSNVDLTGADLSGADLKKAHLSGANLCHANLTGADLSRAGLEGADLSGAHLSGVNLSEARLISTNLRGACFINADLRGACFINADLRGANLSGADLRGAVIDATYLIDLDLRWVKGLESMRHEGPSYISTSTLERSQGAIPESFLRQAGLSDISLEYVRALAIQAIPYFTCFIISSRQNQEFVEQLCADLQRRGIRCWYVPLEDLRPVDRSTQYDGDEAIRRLYDKYLLVISSHSMKWMDVEVCATLIIEAKRKKEVLIPIGLDDTIFTSDQQWAADLRQQRYIGNFTRWKEQDHYQKALQRLLRDLQAEKRMGE